MVEIIAIQQYVLYAPNTNPRKVTEPNFVFIIINITEHNTQVLTNRVFLAKIRLIKREGVRHRGTP